MTNDWSCFTIAADRGKEVLATLCGFAAWREIPFLFNQFLLDIQSLSNIICRGDS
jgi:hypothetical protein